MLEGKQFFSWEIAEVLDQALPGSPAALEAGRLADLDSSLADPPTYRRGSALWEQADGALSSLAGSAQVAALVSGLPVDRNPPAPSWWLPAGIVASLVGLYWWTRRG